MDGSGVGPVPSEVSTEGVRSEQKKPAGEPAGGCEIKQRQARLRDRLRDRRVEIDGVRVVAFDAVKLVAALQHPVEFVDQHGDRLVALVRPDGRIHIGPVDLDVTLGRELHADGGVAVAFQFDAEPHNAFLVTKQSLGFLMDKRLQRRGQLEVDAGYNYFVVVLAVHVSACGFG